LIESARIKTGLAVGCALFAVISGAVIYRGLRREQNARQVARAHEAIETLKDLLALSKDADAAARIFVLDSGKPDQDLARSIQGLRDAKTLEARVEELVAPDGSSDNAVPREKALAVRHLIDGQLDAMSAAARSGNGQDVAAALAGLDRAGSSSRIRAAIFDLQARQRGIVLEGTAFQQRSTGLSRKLMISAGIFSLCLMGIAGWRMSADLRRRAAAERALAAKEEQYRRVVELAGDIICVTDDQGRFTFCNRAALTMLHFTEAEVLGRSWLKLVRQDRRLAVHRFYLRQFARRQESTYCEFPVIDAHGQERWVGQNVQLVIGGGKAMGFQAIAREITDRKRAEAALLRSRNFVERIAATTPGFLYVFDLLEQRHIFSNREVFTILGYEPEEMQQKDGLARSLYHPDDDAMIKAHQEALRTARDGEVLRVEYRARHAAGHWVWLAGRETAFERGPDGMVAKIVGICQDITTRKAAQEKLAYQANYDALTGLANRHYFWTRLQDALLRAGVEHSGLSVCLFDVDRFKDINDRFGHTVGDEVLETVGNIVRAELRSSDIAGRFGGDEFCFALPGADDQEAARVAERIRNRLGTLAFGMSGGAPFPVTATFGVAASGAGVLDAKELMEAADQALYRAKAAGRNRVVVSA